MNILEETRNIKKYIEKNYNIELTIEDYLHKDQNAIFYRKGKCELTIHINEPSKNSYAPNNYLFYFDFQNKFGDWRGGGYASIYLQNDKTEVDKFLKEQGINKVKSKQQNIFDMLGDD